MSAKVVIQIKLEYDFDVKTKNAAITKAENIELPVEYVENSFNIVQIIIDWKRGSKILTTKEKKQDRFDKMKFAAFEAVYETLPNHFTMEKRLAKAICETSDDRPIDREKLAEYFKLMRSKWLNINVPAMAKPVMVFARKKIYFVKEQ